MLWFKRFLLASAVLLLLFSGSVVFISWKYGDDLKKAALNSVRSSLTSEVEFDESVKLSIWNDFPLIAIELSDVIVEDGFKADTILKVEKAFIQFNVIKLIQNDIRIEGIRVSNGFLRLRRTKDDKWNYRVWKEPETKNEDGKTNFSIEILTLENVHLDYDDRTVDLNIQFLSNISKLNGRFQEKNARISMSLNGFMDKLTTAGDDRIVRLPMNVKGILTVNSKDKIYTVETGNAILAGNEMVFNTEWESLESGGNMFLKIHAGNMEPSTLLPHVWPQMPENVSNLNLHGESDLILMLDGPFTFASGPKVDATIRMRNGGLTFQNTQVSELNYEGKIHMDDIKKSKAIEVQFDSFDLKTPAGIISGSGTLTDLNNPKLRIKTKGSSTLEELITVSNIEDALQASGPISWDIDFQGPLGKDFNTTLNELKQMNWSGNLSLMEATMKFNSGIPELQSINANVSMNQGKTVITECSGSIGHLDFKGNLEIAELKRILVEPNSPVDITGQVHVQKMDVVKLPMEWQFESESSKKSEYRPVSISVNGQFDQIVYHDFTATDVSGRIDLKDNRVDIESLSLNALGGQINSSLAFYPNNNGYFLNLDGNFQSIDISRTLREWNNFGQESIKSENLEGKASGEIQADVQLNEAYELMLDEIQVEADVEVVGGVLIEFEPLLAMSRFIDVDELNRVKFDTLRNELSIRDSKLEIPRMNISSSVLNVNVFGEHGFNQEMDYHVNLLLNDIIRRKAKKRRTFDGHEILDEKGKTRLFLWVRGTPDNIKVGFDKREVRNKIKSNLKKEGRIIKQLFKDEFSGNQTEEESSDETIQFRLDDDGLGNKSEETRSTDDTNENQNRKKKKKKRGLFSSEANEEETEGGFEIEFDP